MVAGGASGVSFFVGQSGFVQKPMEISVSNFPLFLLAARPPSLTIVLARVVTALETTNVVYNVVPAPASVASVSVFVGAVVFDCLPFCF